MALCPDSVGGGWKAKTTRNWEKSVPLKAWGRSPLPPLRALLHHLFGVRSRHCSSPSLSLSYSSQPFGSHVCFPAMHKYVAELIRNEDGWSDSCMALLQAPCVASSSHISVSPQKMTNKTSLLPKGIRG